MKRQMFARQVLFLLFFLLMLSACDAGQATPTPAQNTAVPAEAITLPSRPLAYDADGLDLVFQGGGAKGLAHIGALRELERQGRGYRRLVGTSAGSIVTVLLAAGYSTAEIEAAITARTPAGNIVMGSFLEPPQKAEFDEAQLRNSITYLSLQDILPESILDSATAELDLLTVEQMLENPYYRGLFSLVETGGLYSGAPFVAWLRDRLDADGRNLGEATLAQFHERTGAFLTIVATDATDRIMLILNHRTAPDLPVVWAVRMSTGIPIIFQEVAWRPEWGSYRGEDISGHLVVDGGVTTNLPLSLVLSREPEITSAMSLEPDPVRVLGLVLDQEQPFGAPESAPAATPTPDWDNVENARIAQRWQEIETRTLNLVDTLLNANDRLLAATYPEHVCNLPVGGMETLEYDMSDAKITRLLDAAQAQMRACLETLGK